MHVCSWNKYFRLTTCVCLSLIWNIVRGLALALGVPSMWNDWDSWGAPPFCYYFLLPSPSCTFPPPHRRVPHSPRHGVGRIPLPEALPPTHVYLSQGEKKPITGPCPSPAFSCYAIRSLSRHLAGSPRHGAKVVLSFPGFRKKEKSWSVSTPLMPCMQGKVLQINPKFQCKWFLSAHIRGQDPLCGHSKSKTVIWHTYVCSLLDDTAASFSGSLQMWANHEAEQQKIFKKRSLTQSTSKDLVTRNQIDIPKVFQ